jgi:3-hydroxybutyryl-CoA dehydrogenase
VTGRKKDMKNVLVLGTGTMGLGIAQVLAQAGCKVYVASARNFPEIKAELVQKALQKIENNLQRSVSKNKMTEDKKNEIMANFMPVSDLKSIAEELDLVIEAAAEDMEIKKNIFLELDKICKPETVLSTNSSALSITELANVTNRKGRFLGIHFFNPPPVMALVEIIKGESTQQDVVDDIYKFIESIGKSPILVNEAPGFVVNRILVPMINEATYTLMEGVASAEDIDKGMKLGANHPIGPLALADLIGLDVCLSVMETLYREFGDPKYRPCPILRKMVRAGFLGRKTGKGFFNYV